MEWYLDCFRVKYATFAGRARRSEFWYFQLCNVIVLLLLILPLVFVRNGFQWLTIPYLLYILGAIVPSLAVNVRRLHDINKSGWWTLIALIPFVGGIVLLVFHCTDSEVATNKYGPNPKLATAAV